MFLCSKEKSRQDSSFAYPQRFMIERYNNYFLITHLSRDIKMDIIDRKKIMVFFYVILIRNVYRFCSEHLFEWLLSPYSIVHRI